MTLLLIVVVLALICGILIFVLFKMLKGNAELKRSVQDLEDKREAEARQHEEQMDMLRDIAKTERTLNKAYEEADKEAKEDAEKINTGSTTDRFNASLDILRNKRKAGDGSGS